MVGEIVRRVNRTRHRTMLCFASDTAYHSAMRYVWFARLVVIAAAWLAAVDRPALAQAGLAPDEAMVGFGGADVTPEIGVPLAGYSNRRAGVSQWFGGDARATWFRGSTGVHDPIQAQAMTIARDGRRLVFLRLDLVAVSRDLIAAIRTRLTDLDIAEEQIVISATHTHSGPGAWMDSTVWALIGTDRYRPEVFSRLAEGAEKAVRAAVAAEGPARLFAGSFAVDGLQRNRRDRAAPVDTTAHLILAQGRGGAWRGGLFNYAIHATAISAENLAFTADVAGAVERQVAAMLKSRNTSSDEPAPVVLFLNGALGDVSPVERGFEGIERTGQALARAAERTLSELRPIGGGWAATKTEVDLGVPGIPLRNCLRPTWLRWIIGHDPRVRLADALPHSATLRLIRLGDVTIMTWPGEPTSALGFALNAAARESGAMHTMVIGVANDYLAYFTSPAEFARPSYESCMSWFGPQAGEKIVAAYRRLLAPPTR